MIQFCCAVSQHTLTVISPCSLNSTYFGTSANVHEYSISICEWYSLTYMFYMSKFESAKSDFRNRHHIVGGRNRNKTPVTRGSIKVSTVPLNNTRFLNARKNAFISQQTSTGNDIAQNIIYFDCFSNSCHGLANTFLSRFWQPSHTAYFQEFQILRRRLHKFLEPTFREWLCYSRKHGMFSVCHFHIRSLIFNQYSTKKK